MMVSCLRWKKGQFNYITVSAYVIELKVHSLHHAREHRMHENDSVIFERQRLKRRFNARQIHRKSQRGLTHPSQPDPKDGRQPSKKGII